MFTKIKATNFKAFEALDVELRPITVFLGPNNSGKSAILSSLRLLSQTIISNESEIPLVLTGVFGDFGTFKDIVFGNDTSTPISFELAIRPDWDILGFGVFRTWPYGVEKLGIKLEFSYQEEKKQLSLDKTQIIKDDQLFMTTERGDKSGRQNLTWATYPENGHNIQVTIGLGNFLPNGYRIIKPEEIRQAGSDLIRQSGEITDSIWQAFRNIEYVGPIRSYRQRTYQFKGSPSKRVGMNGENAFGIMANSVVNDNFQNDLQNNLSNWLSRAGIASTVTINQISDRHFEILVQHLETGEYQNIADVGQGNSQIFPVIVGGEILEPHSTFLVEQPEIHLHPKAQAELGSFFYHLYKKNIQSLIETHSEHLILRLQQYVASGEISPDDIAVYYVYADGKEKRVERLRLDELGRFIDEWPEGFFPEGLQEAEKLSRIRFEARAKRNGTRH